ncbi:hypothetical protein ACQJBY_073691 [Aegilops geniculata]
MEPRNDTGYGLDRVLDSMRSSTDTDMVRMSFMGGGDLRIHQAPSFLYGLKNAARLFLPDVVSIGPYYHGRPQLQNIEGIKKMAANEFCCSSTAHQVHDFYLNVQEVAQQARASYGDDEYMSQFDDEAFTAMMFFDGCFMLQFMTMVALDRGPPEQWKMPQLSENWIRRISRDILLLENQIPWVVLEALMRLKPVRLDRYIADAISNFDVQGASPRVVLDDYKPFHLLDLVRHHQVGSLGTPTVVPEAPRQIVNISSALEVVEVGVHLTAGKTARFSDMGVGKNPLFGKLRLPAVYLSELTMCMAMFEIFQAAASQSDAEYGVSSYMQIMAVLMNREDDVRELRSKRILYPVLSDLDTIDFFKSLCPFLQYGRQYVRVMKQLSDYQQDRRVRVGLHKFVYNNFKYMLTSLSALGFLVPILKGVLSLNETNQRGALRVGSPHPDGDKPKKMKNNGGGRKKG